MIQLENVSKFYGEEPNRVTALSRVSLEITRGEYLSIMGPSGSGKSTLFNMVGGLDLCSEGRVVIGGVSLDELTEGQLAFFRGRHIGYIFQAFNLIASMTACENVSLPALLAGKDDAQANEMARSRLEQVGLGHRMDHRPDELSGGQQQRVAIARALVNTPTIVLADEPTANLDLNTGAEVIALLQELCRALGVTVVTATHDHKMLKASDRILWIKDGRIERIERAEDMNIDAGGMEG